VPLVLGLRLGGCLCAQRFRDLERGTHVGDALLVEGDVRAAAAVEVFDVGFGAPRGKVEFGGIGLGGWIQFCADLRDGRREGGGFGLDGKLGGLRSTGRCGFAGGCGTRSEACVRVKGVDLVF
jgi:hypothetical protein